jgi:hypothetical protein
MTRSRLARALALAAAATVAAALAGCGKTGELERPAPLFGRAPAAGAQANRTNQTARPVETIDPRDQILNPAPPRTAPISGQSPNPTNVAPQGVLPDPYANPQ